MRKIFFTALCLLATAVAFAQSDTHHQILIFRNTGATDIVYTDNLKGIELSCFDKDSVEHDGYVSQVFKRINGDNIIVPIAEIDSVAFGPRRIIEAKPDVRRLTDEEASAISAFDETYIIYPSGTPTSLMVSQGETVYYDVITETLPYGLCARIGAAGTTQEGTRYDIEFLDPADVFNRYFVSEDTSETPQDTPKKTTDGETKDGATHIDLEGNINSFHYDISAGLEASMTVSESLFDALRHRYHAKVEIFVGTKLEINITSESSKNISEATVPKSLVRVQALLGLISVGVEARAFLEAVAEIALNIEETSGRFIEFEWTRENGEDTFSDVRITQPGKIDRQTKSEVLLNGEIFTGGELDFLLGGIWERTGAVAAFKLGPFIHGELGAEMLSKMSENWQPEYSMKGSLNMGLRAQLDTYWFKNISLGGAANREYFELPFKQKFDLGSVNLNLFPELPTRSTRGMAANQLEESDAPAVDVATYSETDIEIPLEVGYQLVNDLTDNVIQETMLEEPIEAHAEEPQQFYEEFILDEATAKIDHKNLRVQPIFKYAGYTIKAKPTNVAGDMVFSPLNATMHSPGQYFVTGMTPVSQSNKGELTFVEGNLLPFHFANNPYKNQRTANIISWIETSQGGSGSLPKNYLIGTWNGHCDGNDVTMNFSDENSGTYNGISFTYTLNKPSVGGLSMTLDNGKRIMMYLLDIDDTQLIVTNKAKTKIYKFNRQ